MIYTGHIICLMIKDGLIYITSEPILLSMSLTYLIPVLFIGVAIIGSVIQIIREPRAVSHSRMAEIFLNWAFVVIIGLGGIWAFVGHTVFSDQVAESIGWPSGNPFQQEVAFADLAIGILGILSVRIEGTFRIAALLAYTIFMVGAGIGHIWQIFTVHNMAINNAGLILWFDIFIPLILIGLYLFSVKLKKSEAQPSLRRH